MNIFNKFLVVALLLASMSTQNIFAMDRENVECPLASSAEEVSEMVLTLKVQLALSIFIVMRVNFAVDQGEKHWQKLSFDGSECCRLFSIPTKENLEKFLASVEQDSGKLYPLNCAWTDLYFIRRLLDHLDFLHNPAVTKFKGLCIHQRQAIALMAYEVLCTLSSLWIPNNYDDTQDCLIDKLSGSYHAQKSFDGVEIFMSDITLLLDMNKTLLGKLLDLKFLRSYPCNYNNENERQYGKGYLKRENFCTHYIEEHCCYFERGTLYYILQWFRQKSYELSSEQVYDFVLNCFKQVSEDSSSEQDSSTDEEYDFLSSYRIIRY